MESKEKVMSRKAVVRIYEWLHADGLRIMVEDVWQISRRSFAKKSLVNIYEPRLENRHEAVIT